MVKRLKYCISRSNWENFNEDTGELPNPCCYRTLSTIDGDALGDLLYHSYLNTVDYEGETYAESIIEMNNILNGKYAPILFEKSIAIADSSDQLRCAAIFGLLDDSTPCLLLLMTKPAFKNQGYAKLLMKEALNRIFKSKFENCCLFVNPLNNHAIHLYEMLGFQLSDTNT